MQTRTWLRLAMAGSLTCALAAGAETPTTAAPETSREGAVASPTEAAATAASPNATTDAVVVVRDPETGALRAPTATEAAALRLGMDPLAESDAGLTPTFRAGGGRSLVLGDRFMTTSVLNRVAPGADDKTCADDPKAVENALATAPAEASEVDRDDQ